MFRSAITISHTAQKSLLLVEMDETTAAIRSPVSASSVQDNEREGANNHSEAKEFVGANEMAERKEEAIESSSCRFWRDLRGVNCYFADGLVD